MLRLRNRLLSTVCAASHLRAAASLHRLHPLPLSTATTSSAPFVAEDYLVTACGLTRAQALKSSRYLSHLKSPSNADAVLAFFADMGLARADIAAIIAREPRLLRLKVDKTLSPCIGKLRDLGLTLPQISSLLAIDTNICRSASAIPRFAFYFSLLGSYEKVQTALKRSKYYLLNGDVERVVKPNMSFLQHCGLTNNDVAHTVLLAPNMFVAKPERIKEIVVGAEQLGVPRDSAMFKHALVAVYGISPERVASRLDFLKKALGCSEAEVRIAVRKCPGVLSFTEGTRSRSVEFLKMDVGLEPNYIVHRPALLKYSMKRRLMPRHYVLKVLKLKGLVKKDIDFYGVVCLTEQRFVKKFLDPYKEDVPGLAVAYAEYVSPRTKP